MTGIVRDMRLFAASLALLAALAPGSAAACSCVELTAERAFEQHAVVFEGRVLETTPPDEPSGALRVVLEVVQRWKGADSERIELVTPAVESMCGVSFVPETSWLVYADVGADGAMTTGLCDRTRRIEQAEEDLAFLGAGVTPVDIGEEDEVEDPAEDEAPARGGCASCAAAPARSGVPLLALLVVALFVTRRSRRTRAAAAGRSRAAGSGGAARRASRDRAR